MTVILEPNEVQYTASGNDSAFPFTFRCFTNDDIQVYLGDTPLPNNGIDFAVDLGPDNGMNGGTVYLYTQSDGQPYKPSTGTKIRIKLWLDLTQPYDLSDGVKPEIVEAMSDRIVKLLQLGVGGGGGPGGDYVPVSGGTFQGHVFFNQGLSSNYGKDIAIDKANADISRLVMRISNSGAMAGFLVDSQGSRDNTMIVFDRDDQNELRVRLNYIAECVHEPTTDMGIVTKKWAEEHLGGGGSVPGECPEQEWKVCNPDAAVEGFNWLALRISNGGNYAGLTAAYGDPDSEIEQAFCFLDLQNSVVQMPVKTRFWNGIESEDDIFHTSPQGQWQKYGIRISDDGNMAGLIGIDRSNVESAFIMHDWTGATLRTRFQYLVECMQEPTTDMSVVTKKWAEDNLGGGTPPDGQYVPVTGGTFTGMVYFNAGMFSDQGKDVGVLSPDGDIRAVKLRISTDKTKAGIIVDTAGASDSAILVYDDAAGYARVRLNYTAECANEPTTDMSIVTKKWAEDNLGGGGGSDYVPITGGTFTGLVNFEAGLESTQGADIAVSRSTGTVRKVNMSLSSDGSLGGIKIDYDDLVDVGMVVFDKVGSSKRVRLNYLAECVNEPTTDMSIVTKKWAEDNLGGGDGDYMPKTGGTFTGPVNFSGGDALVTDNSYDMGIYDQWEGSVRSLVMRIANDGSKAGMIASEADPDNGTTIWYVTFDGSWHYTVAMGARLNTKAQEQEKSPERILNEELATRIFTRKDELKQEVLKILTEVK